MQTFYNNKFFYVFCGVWPRRIINSYIKFSGYQYSTARLNFLFCSTLQGGSLFASLYPVIFEKAKCIKSTPLSVCCKSCKVWHVKFCGSLFHSTNNVLTDYYGVHYSFLCTWSLSPHLIVLRGTNIFWNVFAVMNFTMNTIRGKNSVAWSCR